MAIIGSSFTKINVEKKAPVKGKISISSKFLIKSITEQPLGTGITGKKGLKITLEFIWKYEPKIGEMSIEGDTILLLESKKVEEVLNSWKKDKKIPKEIMTPLLNSALTKNNIQALILSRDVGLPPPVRLPRVKVEQKS